MLISIKGDQWKALRSKLSPTFTTGKIKRLFSLFDVSGRKLVKFVEGEMADGNGEMDLSQAYSKFAMDIIASAVCGIDSQTFDQKEPSLFEKMGTKLQFKLGGLGMFKMFMILVFPRLTDFLGMSFFEMEMQNFFSSAIKSSIKQRKESGEKRNDFIQLMLEAREDKLKTDENELDSFEKDAVMVNGEGGGNNKVSTADLLDDDGIVANAVLFMLAGYDTTQSLLLYCAYALALNQDVQDKLREEVESVLEGNDGELTYDALNKMTYLDMVINGTFT
jgi:cytochrome P450